MGLVYRLHKCLQEGNESRANIGNKGKCLKSRYSIHKKKGVMLRNGVKRRINCVLS